MIKCFLLFLVLFFCSTLYSYSQNYNFNNSIVAVSSVNNSAFKKSKINKYINYFTKTEKGRVFLSRLTGSKGFLKIELKRF